MNSSTSECLNELLNAVREWMGMFEVLLQSINAWRLEHSNEKDDWQPSQPKVSSSTESLRPIYHTPLTIKKPTECSPAIGAQQGLERVDTVKTSGKMRVIHYDSNVQMQMETLAAAINKGRGYVRKGKIAARTLPYAALRVDSVGGRYQRAEIFQGAFPAEHRECTASSRNRRGLIEPTFMPAQAFDTLELVLLDSQTLCEHAAHQVLRDGDCDDDLGMLKQCFQIIMQICAEEIENVSDKHHLGKDDANMKRLVNHESTSHSSPTNPFEHDMTLQVLDVDDGDESDDFSAAVSPRRRHISHHE